MMLDDCEKGRCCQNILRYLQLRQVLQCITTIEKQLSVVHQGWLRSTYKSPSSVGGTSDRKGIKASSRSNYETVSTKKKGQGGGDGWQKLCRAARIFQKGRPLQFREAITAGEECTFKGALVKELRSVTIDVVS